MNMNMGDSKCGCGCGCGGGGCGHGHGCTPHMIGKILIIIGGINWGLVGVGMLMNTDWNVVHMIFGSMPTLEAIIYILVGIAAIGKIFGCRCKKCIGGVCNSCGTGDMDKNMNKSM